MEIRVTSADADTWEGPAEDFLESQEIPELVRRRIEQLRLGERVSFDFTTRFNIERTT